jgi:hypothetical protein
MLVHGVEKTVESNAIVQILPGMQFVADLYG